MDQDTLERFKKEFETNRRTWNEKAVHHFEGDFYNKEQFARTVNSLNTYEIDALGDVSGKSLLHLQCHFGQDSLSWAAKGATVTGVDISDQAIATAKKLSKELQAPADFVCCNVLETDRYIDQHFDIVFTSYGVIGWLPDLKPWAQMIAHRLKPGGTFYMVEFHPIAWMYDYTISPPKMKYHYYQREAIYEEYAGTYGSPKAKMTSREYGWNHGLSDVIQALLDAGLTLTHFAEHEGSPYDVFPGLEQRADELFYIPDGLYPLLFEVKAVKDSISQS